MEQTSWWLQRSHLEQTLALHLAVSLDDDSCMTIRSRNLKVWRLPLRRASQCPTREPAPHPWANALTAITTGASCAKAEPTAAHFSDDAALLELLAEFMELRSAVRIAKRQKAQQQHEQSAHYCSSAKLDRGGA